MLCAFVVASDVLGFAHAEKKEEESTSKAQHGNTRLLEKRILRSFAVNMRRNKTPAKQGKANTNLDNLIGSIASQIDSIDVQELRSFA